MTDRDITLTTREYSKKTGMAISTITQRLRQGMLRGEKRNGKWAIDASESQNTATATDKNILKIAGKSGPAIEKRSSAEYDSIKAYDVSTFAQMTYLTEKGVRQWFKCGRLSGRVDAGGKLLVDATNLDRPELSHLVRK